MPSLTTILAALDEISHRWNGPTDAAKLVRAERSREPERSERLDSLARTFDASAVAGVGRDVLRESKQVAWPIRRSRCD